MIPKVVQVIPTENYNVYVYFEDGKIVCYDTKHLLNKEVFSVLKDLHFFINNCTVMNDTLAWDLTGNRDTTNCIDIDPYSLYKLNHIKEDLTINDLKKFTTIQNN